MTVHSYWLCVYSEYLNTELCYTHSEVYYSVLFHLFASCDWNALCNEMDQA